MIQVNEQEQNGIEPNKPPDKQANYRSYFLRMYLYIAHIWKMVIKNNVKRIKLSFKPKCHTVTDGMKLLLFLCYNKITRCPFI